MYLLFCGFFRSLLRGEYLRLSCDGWNLGQAPFADLQGDCGFFRLFFSTTASFSTRFSLCRRGVLSYNR